MKQIDWEQRRYELTKDIFIAFVRADPEKTHLALCGIRT